MAATFYAEVLTPAESTGISAASLASTMPQLMRQPDTDYDRPSVRQHVAQACVMSAMHSGDVVKPASAIAAFPATLGQSLSDSATASEVGPFIHSSSGG